MTTTDPTPRNVVDNPVLNSPFREPERYWDFSAPTPRIASGRRPAGYYGKLPEGALATQEMKTLVRVNDIRGRVRAWRERGYEGVTRVTRDLLQHWSQTDRRPLFFCQREAVETLIWLAEASAADRQGADVPLDEPGPNERAESGFGPLTRWCTKMATGSGKTIVMAMIVNDFGLVDAIESGITKVPRIPVADDSGRPDPKYFRLWKHIMEQLPLPRHARQPDVGRHGDLAPRALRPGARVRAQ